MRLRMLIAVACLAQAAASPAWPQPADGAVEMVQGAVDGYIRPAYAEFAAAADVLRGSVGALCGGPSEESLGSARSNFGETVRAWASIELVRFGPVTQENRLERVFYWPDRRSTGLKQVQGILAAQDASATSIDTLVQKSVAVQGLGALEFVLFGTGSEELATSAGFRCEYARTVTANLAAMANEVRDAWETDDGIVRLWTSPGPDNPLYRDGREALSELMDVAIHGLELVRDVRITGFLADTAGGDRSTQAPFWRSRQTIPAIRANLRSIGGMLDAAELSEHLREDSRWMADSIRFELSNAGRMLETLGEEPIAEVLADVEKRAKLDYVRIVISSLSDLVGRQLTSEFGLTAGFSALDGD